MGEIIRAIGQHLSVGSGRSGSVQSRVYGCAYGNSPGSTRHVDYVGLAYKINKGHNDALTMLEAYDRGEAEVVDGKLKRVQSDD